MDVTRGVSGFSYPDPDADEELMRAILGGPAVDYLNSQPNPKGEYGWVQVGPEHAEAAKCGLPVAEYLRLGQVPDYQI